MEEIYFVIVNLICCRRLVWTDPDSPVKRFRNTQFNNINITKKLKKHMWNMSKRRAQKKPEQKHER